MLFRFVQKNKLVSHTDAELLTPGQVGHLVNLGCIYDLDGKELESAPHPQMEFLLRLPVDVHAGDILRGAGA